MRETLKYRQIVRSICSDISQSSCDEGNSRLEVTLVLGQQRQRLLAVALGLEHGSSKDLHGVVFGVVLCEFLCELQGSVCVAG